MKRLWIFLIRLSLLLVVICSTTGTLFVYVTSYEDFTSIIASGIGQSTKLEKFRELLLTRERFTLLRVIALAATILSFITVPFLWKRAVNASSISSRIVTYSKSHLQSYISFWQTLPIAAKYSTAILFLLIIFSRLYFIFRFPFHVDERFTYLYFVDKGIAVSMAYYPGPNNHILYTLICNVFAIFITDPVLVMKLPALLIGLLLSGLFWIVVSQYFAYPLALLAVALFSFAEPVFYYSMQGRGYVLLMFFVLLATHHAIKIAQCTNYSFSNFFWLWLSCVCGFYTIPIFLYPFISLLVFVSLQLVVQNKYRLLIPFFFTSAAITNGVLLLYLPVIVFNGWQALAANSWVAPKAWQEFTLSFPGHIQELASDLWGILPGGQWLTALSILFCLISIIRKQTTPAAVQWMQLYLINLVVLVGMSFMQRLLLPIRILFYISIYQYVVLAYAGSRISQALYTYLKLFSQNRAVEKSHKQPYIKYSIKLVIASLVSLVFIILSIYRFQALTAPGQFSIYKSFDATSQWLFQHQANNMFVNDYDYSLCIRFLYETSGREIQLDTNQPQHGKQYTYLVIHSSQPFPASVALNQYQSVYRDGEIIIYKKL